MPQTTIPDPSPQREAECSGACQQEAMSVCTSLSMPSAMQRTAGWRAEQFKLHKQVYEGRTSQLFHATDRQSGLPVALKLYRKKKLTELNRIQIEREINIHIGLFHENIINLWAAFEDERNVYLVLELADGGDLFHQVKTSVGHQYSERKAAQQVIIPFLKALIYLHSKGIVHRDIKPENILLTSGGTLKLADFGLAIDVYEERPVTRLGTLDYMAPEVLLCPDKKLPEENKDRQDLSYSSEVDVWALGILTFEIIAGHAPFERETRLETYENILKRDPVYPSCISDEARRFIRSTLVKDPSRRPTASKLMEHPWVRYYAQPSSASIKGGSVADYQDCSATSEPKTQPETARSPAAPTPFQTPKADLHVYLHALATITSSQDQVQPSSGASATGPDTPCALAHSRGTGSNSGPSEVFTAAAASALLLPSQRGSASLYTALRPSLSVSRLASLSGVGTAENGTPPKHAFGIPCSGALSSKSHPLTSPCAINGSPFSSSLRQLQHHHSAEVGWPGHTIPQDTGLTIPGSTPPSRLMPCSQMHLPSTTTLPSLYAETNSNGGIFGHAHSGPLMGKQPSKVESLASSTAVVLLSPVPRVASQPSLSASYSSRALTSASNSAPAAATTVASSSSGAACAVPMPPQSQPQPQPVLRPAASPARSGIRGMSLGLAALLSPSARKSASGVLPSHKQHSCGKESPDIGAGAPFSTSSKTLPNAKVSKLFCRTNSGIFGLGDNCDAVLQIGTPGSEAMPMLSPLHPRASLLSPARGTSRGQRSPLLKSADWSQQAQACGLSGRLASLPGNADFQAETAPDVMPRQNSRLGL